MKFMLFLNDLSNRDMKMNFTYMNIRSGTTFDKSLRFTFGNVHEMPRWSTWLSEYIYIFIIL
jgi:hypothetical protein